MIRLLVVFVCACSSHCLFAQTAASEAIRSGHWNKADESEYRACVTRMAKSEKPNDGGTPEAWCEVWEEHHHWTRAHPQVGKRKESHEAFSKCNKSHAREMNGTPEAFWRAMDQCLSEAYGLAKNKYERKD
jgi:hypothetical protein